MVENDLSRDIFFSFLRRYRGFIVWSISIIFFLWMFLSVKEVTSLLLLSYGIVLLIDPLVTKLESPRLSRGLIIVGLQILLLLIFLAIFLLALPILLDQYNNLIQALPGYIQGAATKVRYLLEEQLKLDLPGSPDAYIEELKNQFSNLGVEQLRTAFRTLTNAIMGGYSWTLALLNLSLLPFFVYYLGTELRKIHRFVYNHLPLEIRDTTVDILRQIMQHVYAFFRGQTTVAVVMAVLYWLGLWAVGLPWAFVVGLLSGLLNVVPYLGIAIGIVLATILTLVTEPHLSQFLLVWGVFVGVQLLESFVLTPKIVGEQVGIHALTVIIALIIGSQLFGFAGLILAIPGAAALKVLVNRFLLEEEESNLASLPAPN